jgi:D-alanine-D-alanine ligase
VRRELGLPVFVKPANLGSSVGISKAARAKEFSRAIKEAFRYDFKILIEENISGREIECAVLGNEHPRASLPGEIVTGHDFYSYQAKYVDDQGARLLIPAALPPAVTRRIQQLALQAFKVLCCSGMARVDFFLRGKSEIFVNEINTIPGFTAISMYPKMWGASGLSYPRLIDRLIQLALEAFRAEQRLRSTL